ncbi:MAG: hypothetical protein CUN55_01860 [Phototrophicales bacterium]|nr:MAG: hypothetical protein CUN55_01860 [Phototrophicales bacterium]
MPTTIGILTPQGLESASYQADSLTEASRYEPSGIYTVTRTYNRFYVLKFDAHLDRLEESARLENIPVHIDRFTLRKAIRTLIERSGYDECRFRITIPHQQPDHFIITLEPFTGIPQTLKMHGVKVATVPIKRENPQAKDTTWIAKREAAKANVPDAYEYIIVNEQGQLLEGFSSNFYAILNQTLWTAPNELVLGGISRQIVLEIAPSVLPIRLEPIVKNQIKDISGAFLTSSSRGIIPIVQIDQDIIDNGKPNPTVQTLSERYDQWVTSHLEHL